MPPMSMEALQLHHENAHKQLRKSKESDCKWLSLLESIIAKYYLVHLLSFIHYDKLFSRYHKKDIFYDNWQYHYINKL